MSNSMRSGPRRRTSGMNSCRNSSKVAILKISISYLNRRLGMKNLVVAFGFQALLAPALAPDKEIEAKAIE